MSKMMDIDLVTIASDVVSFLVVDTLVETRSLEGIRYAFNMSKITEGLALAASALVATWLNDWLSSGDKPMIKEPANETIRTAIPAVMAGAVFALYKKFMSDSSRSMVSNLIGGAASIYVSRNFVADYVKKLTGK
jgi:hypothetical protein